MSAGNHIAELKPYPAYRHSNVEWLGDVPEHWEVRRLKNWVGINESTLPETTDSLYEFRYIEIGAVGIGVLTSEPTMVTFGAAPSRARRILKFGDTILSTVRTYLKASWFVEDERPDLICSTGFAVLTPRENTYPQFTGYLVQSDAFADRVTASSVGTVYPAIDESQLGAFPIPLPPLPEQRAIVRYLDYADRRIRRYVGAKRRLVALLQEERQAVVSRAVTRGLDPSVRLKPSGAEWLGDVPEHWEVRRLKNWVGINESVLPETTDPLYEFRYIEIGAAGIGVLTSEPTMVTFGAAPSRARRILKFGDTILSTVRTYLKASWFVENESPDLICSTGFAVLTPRENTYPQFMRYLVQSDAFTDRVTASSVGTVYPAIGESQLGAFPILLPPLAEQRAIVEHLERETARIDAAIERARRQAALVEEYRTRLVADVVTGKLDVREASASLPDEAEDDEDEPMAEDIEGDAFADDGEEESPEVALE